MAASLANDTVITLNKDCLFNFLEDEVVILHLKQGKYYGLNEVGSFIWESLKEVKTLGNVIEKIKDDFDVSNPSLADEIKEFILDLEDKSLISIHAG